MKTPDGKGLAVSVRGQAWARSLSWLRSRFALFAILLVAASTSWPAQAERRVALVMGLSAYRDLQELKNPRNDAADIAEALKQQGFEVLHGEDLGQAAMRELIARFTTLARDADVSLFYYAGHGFQIDSQNYLVPVDALVRDPGSVRQSTIALQSVLSGLEGGRGIRLIFLDACRNNPLPQGATGVAETLRDGLARVGNAANFLLAFATQPDNVAYDGAGRNSPFATALLSHIATRGQDLASMMIKVRRDVIAATGGQQIPWENSSLTRQFAFRPGAPDAITPEVQLWQLGIVLRDPALLKLYVERFPTGAHASEARSFLDPTKLAALEVGTPRSTDAASDDILWDLAARMRMRSLTEFYLHRFPAGRHSDAARKLLGSLPESDSADLPPGTLCERLATHPRDATANLDGVPLEILTGHVDRAIDACRKAMAAHPKMPNYAALLARALWVANQRGEALQLYRTAAERGNLRAMVSLGLILEAGDGVPRDVRGGYALYERAAAGGSPDGAINLAVALMQGGVLPRNVPRAIELLTDASRQGSAIATFNLGVLAEQGLGGTQDQALGHFRKAVELGDMRGYRAAAVLLDEGRGTRKDPDAAAEALLRAVASDAGETLAELTKTAKTWSPETMRALQQRLQREGHLQGGIDGRSGPRLRAPLQRWRQMGSIAYAATR